MNLAKLGILTLLCVSARAQTAQVGGRVTDASGAAIPGASLTVRAKSTGLERHAVTNDLGLYTVPLPTSTVPNTLPSLRMRQGYFGELPANRPINDLTTGQPFPDNTIPAISNSRSSSSGKTNTLAASQKY